MIDTKRKGRNMWCENCNRLTRHICVGVDEKDCVNKDEDGRVHTGKLVHFQCSKCGEYKMINRWS